jgi:hypothetical protein
MPEIYHGGKKLEISQEDFDKLESKYSAGYPLTRVEEGEEYYYICEGEVDKSEEYDCSEDGKRYEMGNYFRTEEEAEECLKSGWYARRLAEIRIERFIAENKLVFKPDWKADDVKWNIYYEHNGDTFKADSSYQVQESALFYFETKVDAELVIKKCKKDLEILFGIK